MRVWLKFPLMFALLLVGACPALVRSHAEDEALLNRCLAADSGSQVELELTRLIEDCSVILSRQKIDKAARVHILIHRGVAYRNLSRGEESLADLTQATRLDPNSAEASRMLGWTLREFGRPRDAEVEYGRALSLELHWQAFLSRCVTRIDLKAYRGALLDCEAALQLDRNEDCLFFTAWLYNRDGRFGRALALLQEARKREAPTARIFFELATSYTSLGQSRAAREAVAEGLRRFPGDADLGDKNSELNSRK